MPPQSHSYGTGSRPEQAPSHLPVVLLSLFLLTQFIFILCLNAQETSPTSTEASEDLAQMFEENAIVSPLCTDSCGLGLELSGLTEAQQRYWSLPAGVFVESVTENGRAYAAGLREGDILISVNGEAVPDPDTACQLLSAFDGNVLQLTYYRDPNTITATIPLTQ